MRWWWVEKKYAFWQASVPETKLFALRVFSRDDTSAPFRPCQVVFQCGRILQGTSPVSNLQRNYNLHLLEATTLSISPRNEVKNHCQVNDFQRQSKQKAGPAKVRDLKVALPRQVFWLYQVVQFFVFCNFLMISDASETSIGTWLDFEVKRFWLRAWQQVAKRSADAARLARLQKAQGKPFRWLNWT